MLRTPFGCHQYIGGHPSKLLTANIRHAAHLLSTSLLTPRHRRHRLDHAMTHQDWTVEDWKRATFSDETKTNRLGSDGRKQAQKLPGEGHRDRLVDGTLKFGGGSVMVWGCMSWAGVGNCCRMDGRMDGDLHTAILDEDVMDSISHFGKTPSDTVFQQDSDPKHACKKAKDWFKYNNT